MECTWRSSIAGLLEAYAEFGRVDVLFANAAIAPFAPLEDVTEDHFDSLFNVSPLHQELSYSHEDIQRDRSQLMFCPKFEGLPEMLSGFAVALLA